MPLDCNEICACRRADSSQQAALLMVQHYRGSSSVNLTDSHCFMAELLADPAANSSQQSPTLFVNTFLAPPVILVTMITNIFVCIVLTRKSMVSPTNVLLLALAFVDMVTGLLPLPWYLLIACCESHMLSVICSSHYVANLLDLMVNTAPTICHTVSIWLTVMLAGQRWIYITFPTSVKQICSVKKSIICIVVVCSVTIGFFSITQLLWSGSVYFQSQVMGQSNRSLVVSCSVTDRRHFFLGAMVVRTLVVNIVPSILLILITSMLIKGIHRAKVRRQQLLRSRRGSTRQIDGKKRQEKASTTLMLTIIVGVFLLVELPMTAIMTAYVLVVAHVVSQAAMNLVNASVPFVNFAILVSYPINFFIYCLMSTQFRQTFTSLFSRDPARRQQRTAPSMMECSSRADFDLPSILFRRRSSARRLSSQKPEASSLMMKT